MRRRTALMALGIGLAFAAALPASVSADQDYKYSTNGTCGSDGERAVGIVEIGAGGQTIGYVDDRNYPTGNGLWIYLEDNGIKRLQRGGASITGEKENCQENRYDTEPVLPEGKKPDRCIF